MQTDDLARWVNEIYGELMDLKNKTIGGSALEKYDYLMPFMDLSQLPSGDSIRNHTGAYTYTATKPIAVILTLVVSDPCIIKLREGTGQPVRVAITPEISYDQIFGPYYLDTGQSLIIDPDSETGAISYADLYVYDVKTAHLQEHVVPVVTRKRSTKKK